MFSVSFYVAACTSIFEQAHFRATTSQARLCIWTDMDRYAQTPLRLCSLETQGVNVDENFGQNLDK